MKMLQIAYNRFIALDGLRDIRLRACDITFQYCDNDTWYSYIDETDAEKHFNKIKKSLIDAGYLINL